MKRILLALALVHTFSQAWACDVCSFSGTNSLNGQLLQTNRSFAAVGWNNVRQNSSDGRIYNNHFLNFAGAYAFKEKWQILAVLPLQHQYRKNAEDVIKTTGLSDATISVTYNSFTTPSQKLKPGKHKLFNTAGFKLPTGRYSGDSPEFAPLGTGSFDWIVGSQYIFERKLMGINMSADLQLNMKNQNGFRYGNLYRITSFYFIKKTFGSTILMPFAGLTAETLAKDHSNGFIRNQSGGYGAFALVGLQTLINEKFSLFVRGDIPVWQDFKSFEGPVKANYRIQTQLSVLFNQKTQK
jgi:hypothetical protein